MGSARSTRAPRPAAPDAGWEIRPILLAIIVCTAAATASLTPAGAGMTAMAKKAVY